MIAVARVACSLRLIGQSLFTRCTSHFSNHEISNRLIARLDKQGIREPTDIQEKAREQAIVNNCKVTS